jgi:L-threonylcarbamoyladenylate synthase
MVQKALEAIKNQKLVYVQVGSDEGLIGDIRSKKALEAAYEIMKADIDHCILIGEIGQLYDYVLKIPEIAWDIVDFAERPLEVIYPKGKNVPSEFLNKDGYVKVRLEKEGELGGLLNRFGKGLFFLQISDIENSEDLKNKAAEVVQLKSPYDLPKRIIRLELDGQIEFIKK